MTAERAIEIATASLRRLKEIDPDDAQRFMIEEIDMDKSEMDFCGVTRHRKAVDIEWCIDEQDDPWLPHEVEIPWDVYDDDIADYLSDKYEYFTDNYIIEENEDVN